MYNQFYCLKLRQANIVALLDALSVNELGDGRIELGVHIADVSYFVKENSHTDLEARARYGRWIYSLDEWKNCL